MYSLNRFHTNLCIRPFHLFLTWVLNFNAKKKNLHFDSRDVNNFKVSKGENKRRVLHDWKTKHKSTPKMEKKNSIDEGIDRLIYWPPVQLTRSIRLEWRRLHSSEEINFNINYLFSEISIERGGHEPSQGNQSIARTDVVLTEVSSTSTSTRQTHTHTLLNTRIACV